MNDFLIGLWSATKSGFYMTAGGDQLSGWTEKLQSTSQSQTRTKKRVMVTVWCSAAHLTHDSFLNPGETITSRSMVSKSLRCTKNCQRLQLTFVNRMGPITDCMSHNQYFRSWNWAARFCLIRHIHLTSHQPTTVFSKYLDNFLQGKCFHNQQEAENAFQEFIKSQSAGF